MKQKHQLLLIIAAILIVLVSVANALTEIERYVDTDVAPGGVGSVGDPWDTMTVAEAALDDNGNLVGDDTFITLHLAGSANDTTGVVWSGFTTGTNNYINILGDGEYSLVINDGTPINISNVSHIRFDNINLEVSAITGGALSVFRVSNVVAGSDIRITNSILKGPDDAILAITLVRVEDTDTILSINNSLLYDGGVSASSRAIWVSTNGGVVYAYNCTIADTGLGVVVNDNATGVFTGKNTIVSGTGSLAYSVFGDGTMTLNNCTADDATAENKGGANNKDSVTPNYVNLFEVTEATWWVGKGADISAEAKWFVDSDTDYYGTVRGVRGGWDIGYYEYPASGSLSLYYRRLLERQ